MAEVPLHADILTVDGSLTDETVARAPDELVGSILAERYEIVEKLGAGGMGAVYRVRHLHINRMMAAKILSADRTDEQGARRFAVEAQAAITLTHPNLIVVHDFGVTGKGQPYLVMEYVEGITLDALMKQRGTLSADLLLQIFLQICEGLQYAHSKGIVHRDLKPGNIMIRQPDATICGDSIEPDAIKIVDFGIAKITAEEGQDLTKTGEICGSPYYMSPEQSLGQKIDVRSDVYSLGCVLYEAACGVLPLKGENAMQTLMKHVLEDPAPFAVANPSVKVSTTLEAITFKAMARDPKLRYQTIAEMKADLQKAVSGEQIKMRRRPPKHALKLAWVVAMITAGLLIGGSFKLGWSTLCYAVGITATLLPSMNGSDPQSINNIVLWAGTANYKGQPQIALGLLDIAINRLRSDAVRQAAVVAVKGKIHEERPQWQAIAALEFQSCFETFTTDGDRQLTLMRGDEKRHDFNAKDKHAALAENDFKLAMEMLQHRGAFAEDDVRIARNLVFLADAQRAEGKLADARSNYLNALANLKKFHPRESPMKLHAQEGLKLCGQENVD